MTFKQTFHGIATLFCSYRGKISRLPYLWGSLGLYFLVCLAVFLVILLIILQLAQFPVDSLLLKIFSLLFFLGVVLFAIYSHVVMSIKRLRDCGHNGWWSLLLFVPLVTFVFFLYLCFAPAKLEVKTREALPVE